MGEGEEKGMGLKEGGGVVMDERDRGRGKKGIKKGNGEVSKEGQKMGARKRRDEWEGRSREGVEGIMGEKREGGERDGTRENGGGRR